MRRLRIRRPLLALLVLVALLVIGYAVRAVDHGRSSHETVSSAASTGSGASAASAVALSSLPPQAAQTVRLIQRGGPFPYPRNDGVVFHNTEHLLPAEPDGFYREFTVPTPGASTRGARRVITGRDGAFYYTGDHYETFVRVDVSR